MRVLGAFVGFLGLISSAWAIDPSTAARVQDEIRAFVPALNALTGLPLDANTVFVYDGVAPLDAPLQHEWSDRLPDPEQDILAMSIAVGRDAAGRWVDEHRGGFCLIMVGDSGLAETGRLWDSLKVHELFHCYQHWALRDAGGTSGIERWLTEGQAEWAAETLVGGSVRSRNLFGQYLTGSSLALYDRTYDAFPFYSHLLRHGFDVWHEALELIKRRENGPTFSGFVATVQNLVTWPMGLWRDASRGADWMSSVPGDPEPGVSYERETLRPGDTRILDVASPKHFVVRPNLDKIVTIHVRGAFGALRTDSLSGEVVEDAVTGAGFQKSYCMGTEFQCQCAGGGPPIDSFIDLGRDSIDLALSANGVTEGEVTIEERDLSCCENDGSIPPEWVGSWELDPLYYLDAVYMPRRECSTTINGSQTMQIYPNGTVVRNSINLVSSQVCREGTPRETRSHQMTNGTTLACLRAVARPPRGHQTWVSLRYDTHRTDYAPALPPATEAAYGPGEPPALRMFVGKWDGGTSGRALMGSARLEGGELLIRPAETAGGLPSPPGGRRYRRMSR